MTLYQNLALHVRQVMLDQRALDLCVSESCPDPHVKTIKNSEKCHHPTELTYNICVCYQYSK